MRLPALMPAVMVAVMGCAARPAAQPASPVARVESGQAPCAARVPGVYVWMQDMPGGARIVYTTPQAASIKELRTLVQADTRPRTARAAGGQPMHPPLPQADVAFETLPSGQAVTLTARDPRDIVRLRQVLRDDTLRQQQGSCSAARLPPAGPPPPPPPPLAVTQLAVDPDLAAPCNVDHAEAIDSTDQTRYAHPILDQLARCLIDGALPGSRVAVQGASLEPDEYRLRFGQPRRQSVADYLANAGVARSRIDVVHAFVPDSMAGPLPERAVVVKLAR